jgi:hypothetical protein
MWIEMNLKLIKENEMSDLLFEEVSISEVF